MEPITIYTTTWCADCRRVKAFLKARGLQYQEMNIEEDPSAEDVVLKANDGRRVVPTLEVGGRYFACSPFNPMELASELKIPLDP